VTPSSKVVGDMALFMVQNKLNEEDIYAKGDTIDFPESVISFFKGDLGQPTGGFPDRLQEIILKGKKAITERPGSLREPIDFVALKAELEEKIQRTASDEDVISYLMYPQIFLDYVAIYDKFGDVTKLDTPTFFHGMRMGEQIEVQIEKGKTLIIKLNSIGEPDSDGMRILYFDLNGQGREIEVKDMSITSTKAIRKKAEPTNKEHVGATMPGSVLEVLVKRGDRVSQGDPVVITEAMKMETMIRSTISGVVDQIYVIDGDQIEAGDLLIEIEAK
jgi:pyruvate carboxylase